MADSSIYEDDEVIIWDSEPDEFDNDEDFYLDDDLYEILISSRDDSALKRVENELKLIDYDNELSSGCFKLCDSLEIRFTVSVSKSASRYQKSKGYHYNYNFFFYSPKLKKRIGASWRTTKAVPKSKVRTTGRPFARKPGKVFILEAIARLFNNNAGKLSVTQEKETKTGKKTIELDTDELAVYWLTQFDRFAGDHRSKSDLLNWHGPFARMCAAKVGTFRLNSFCTANAADILNTCVSLANQIQYALNFDNPTSTIADRMRIVRIAVKQYLQDHNVNPAQVDRLLTRMSTPRKTVAKKVSNNMRPQSLPIARYREIYNRLTKEESGITKGLRLMLFLGLKSEEVCGLNKGDFQRLPHYHGAYQLCITRKYGKRNNKHGIIYDEKNEFCRCVPVPYPLYKMFPEKVGQGQENEPLITNDKNHRLRPFVLNKQMDKLLREDIDSITVNRKGTPQKINVAFLPTSYRASCRYYWHYYSGLTEGETLYLLGLSAPDTLSGHYVDFLNETEQFRMNKQLEHGLALLLRDKKPSPCQFTDLSQRTIELFGTIDSRADLNLIIKESVKLSVSSWRGLQITKEEDL